MTKNDKQVKHEFGGIMNDISGSSTGLCVVATMPWHSLRPVKIINHIEVKELCSIT